MASVMSNNINNTKQITLFMEDCRTIGVDVLGPDVNESQFQFAVNEKGQIRFGLGAIKGMGEAPSEAIYLERQNGRFKDIYDFFERMPSSQVNKRVVESLVIAGAFDELDSYHRAQYFDVDNVGRTNIEKLLRYGQSFQDNKNSVENSLFADFADEVQIERPKLLPCAEWQNMHKLNREKEIIGFYLSAHPLDEYKFQYKFINGEFSRNFVLDDKKKEDVDHQNDIASKILDDETDEEEVDLILEVSEDEDLVEETHLKKAEPKGNFNFLNLDEIDAFKEFYQRQFELSLVKGMPEKNEIKRINELSKEYLVSGLTTDYTIFDDNYNSGKKVAYVTLEDYTGSYKFRLNDDDYMKFKEKLEKGRFIILKFKIVIVRSKDKTSGIEVLRYFINVADVVELQLAFEKYAKSLSLIIPVNELNKTDIEFFKTQLLAEKGEHKLNVYLKNPLDNSFIEARAMQQSININYQLIEKIHEFGKFEIYLN